MVALDYFRRLGHDNHRRLSSSTLGKRKEQTSWGVRRDYEKIAAAAGQAMKAADLNRFLVVCALIPTCIAPATTRRNHLRNLESRAHRSAIQNRTQQEYPQPSEPTVKQDEIVPTEVA